MSDGDETFRRLQAIARSASARTGVATPTQEYLTRHLIESFLERLTRTAHDKDFVLKGGILLAAYGVRRPTKDADSNAVSIDVTAEQLGDVINDVAQVPVDDGVVFDVTSTSVQDIRENADYPGLRVRVKASIGTWRGVLAWDVTTGDPIVPAPKLVRIERVLGEPIELLGYAPEATIAEKGVTILERGIASTRWRDYVDIVQLARRGIDEDELLRSSRAVATYRGGAGAGLSSSGRLCRPGASQVGCVATSRRPAGRVRGEPPRTGRPRRFLPRPGLRSRPAVGISPPSPPGIRDNILTTFRVNTAESECTRTSSEPPTSRVITRIL